MDLQSPKPLTAAAASPKKPESIAPAPATKPSRGPARRPDWLPPEFASPQALVDAYRSLLSERTARKQEATNHDSSQGAGARRCDFAACEREYHETGALSDETYRQLEEAGLPRMLVDRYIEGQQAVAQRLRQEMLDEIGGEAAFEALRGWAATSLPQEALAAYDRAMSAGPEEARLALRGMHAAYERAVGRPPQLVTGQPRAGGGERFASLQEVADAMADPRYKRDEAYRQAVIDKVGRSQLR